MLILFVIFNVHPPCISSILFVEIFLKCQLYTLYKPLFSVELKKIYLSKSNKFSHPNNFWHFRPIFLEKKDDNLEHLPKHIFWTIIKQKSVTIRGDGLYQVSIWNFWTIFSIISVIFGVVFKLFWIFRFLAWTKIFSRNLLKINNSDLKFLSFYLQPLFNVNCAVFWNFRFL